MAWAEPLYSRTQVDKAGETLLDPAATPADLSRAEDIVNNWRSAHGLPLLWMNMNLRKMAKKVDSNRIVAQRIKRLVSIKDKLSPSREGHMKLSRMQDIGGCRAIVKNVSDVTALVDLFASSRMSHQLYAKDDYIVAPKDSGYRGVHLKYKCQSEKYPKHCGLRIEVQLRSQLQHIWATAVETVGVFTEQALKSSAGDQDWLRFFVLMGAVIADMEKGNPVPNTPRKKKELIAELRDYEKRLDVLRFLHGYRSAAQVTGLKGKETGQQYFLLRLDANAREFSWEGFAKDQTRKATAEYYKAEREIEGKSGMQAVLVSVERVKTLARAYPNYFLDTAAFADVVAQSLGRKVNGRPRSAS